jgi:hypothetical protein
MDQVLNLSATVQKEVEDYAGAAFLGRTLAISDPDRQTYAVLVVPDRPAKFDSGIVVLARIAEDHVIIEEDLSDRPLWKELLRVGIPREHIVLAYAGEPIP